MVYPHQLTIQLRRKQLLSVFSDPTYANNIIYTGMNPLSLSATPGNEDTTWYDFTDYCSGLDKIALEWTTTQTARGEVSDGRFIAKKGVTGSLTFEGKAMEFIRKHLVDHVAASLNEIEAQITFTGVGIFSGYVMKTTSLSWCEFNSLCVFTVNLKQADEAIQCIEKTMIADNWQGWFQSEPVDNTGAPKFHPRFSYCVERRPNGVLILEWIGMAQLAIIVTIIYTVVFVILTAIVTIINVIIAAINALISIVGGTPLTPMSSPPPPGSTLNGWANLMLEAAGCGREHPAPLIRDYITNVCDKCGIGYDITTIDIFMAPYITQTQSDGVQRTLPNPHYNACYFFPQVQRGVRRFMDWSIFAGNAVPDYRTYYQPANQPVLSLSDLLEELKKVYNARWEIRNKPGLSGSPVPYLYFKRKDWWAEQTALYDFSRGGADRSKIVEGICYEPQDYTLPAFMNGLYQDDPADKCGVEASKEYNGDPYSFNNTSLNPHFDGELDKKTGFAATKFNNDGASTNYLYDALQACWSAVALSGGLTILIFDALGKFIQDYADFAILLQTETVTLPKIVIWDGKVTTTPGNPYLNARAVRNDMMLLGTLVTVGHTGSPGTYPGLTMPDVNPLYPVTKAAGGTITTLLQPSTIPATPPDNYWNRVNSILTHVLGRVGGTASPAGVYEVQDYLGTVKASQPAILVNWPMYFTPYFKGTLWDNFHWIDDPFRYPQIHKKWSVKIPLCKEDIDKLGIASDGGGVKLLSAVTLDTDYYNSGIITDIIADFDTNEGTPGDPGTGQFIELKGYV